MDIVSTCGYCLVAENSIDIMRYMLYACATYTTLSLCIFIWSACDCSWYTYLMKCLDMRSKSISIPHTHSHISYLSRYCVRSKWRHKFEHAKSPIAIRCLRFFDVGLARETSVLSLSVVSEIQSSCTRCVVLPTHEIYCDSHASTEELKFSNDVAMFAVNERNFIIIICIICQIGCCVHPAQMCWRRFDVI